MEETTRAWCQEKRSKEQTKVIFIDSDEVSCGEKDSDCFSTEKKAT